MSLPTNVGSGQIVGRYVVGVIDSPDDTDDEPELIPARGTITFTPSIGYVPNSTTEIPMTIMKAPITGVLDSEGYLCTPDNTTTPEGGLSRGVKLFATDVGQVTGWTYSVKYSFTPVGTVSPHIPDHTLTVPDKSIQDLSKVAPTPYAPVIGIPQIEATALRAEQAALESATSSQESALSAQEAQTSLEAMIVANDTSMTAIANDPTSSFSAAIDEVVGGKVTSGFDIGTVSKLEPTAEPTASLVDGLLNLGLPQGLPGNATMRVDTTAGTRVFITDGVTEVAVRSSTGPRRVPDMYRNGAGSVVEGEVPTISRDGDTVVLQFTGKSETWVSGDTFAQIPTGFRPATTQYLPNGYAGATAPATMNGLGDLRFHANGLVSGRWVWMWTTKDPWPTTLPGTPL